MISKLILVSSCFIALTVSASIFLDVPRIAKASGFIRSKAGSSKIYAPYPSVLEKLFFNEGEFVKKGEIIGELTAERFAAGKSIDFQQAELSKSKETVVQSDLKNIDKVESLSSALTINQLASLREELTRLDAELNIAQARMAMLNRQANRQTLLVQQGFISQEATDQKASEILLFRGQVSNLERVKLALIREITKQTQELELNTSRANTQRSLASRELAVIRQEINEQSARKIQLVAPVSGYVTQMTASAGQLVRPDIPLMTVIPSEGLLEIALLVPSRSIGFIKDRQKVSIRYQAYPYEHYGRHYGVVKEIARAALPPQEVVQHIPVNEPVYTVRVSLPGNYLEYQGKQLPLTPGMVVEADVELDRLKIYQWLLEPLYRLGGRV